MIIQLEGGSAETRRGAKDNLATLAQGWGLDLAEVPAGAGDPAGYDLEHDKAIDPVSLAALIVSLPAAALAVHDLVDRIRKRRRAHELIDRARQLGEQHIVVWLISQDRPIEISSLDPDRLLELATEDQPHP